MNLRIFIQRSEYNTERYEYCKNKIILFIPTQYSISFSGRHAEVVYILVSIKIHIGKYMDSGHYFCYVLDYNTVRWRNCDDGTITYYSGYPDNVYDNLSNENGEKGKCLYYECIRQDCVNGLHKRDILASRT